jgi:hypothetical protein
MTATLSPAQVLMNKIMSLGINQGPDRIIEPLLAELNQFFLTDPHEGA